MTQQRSGGEQATMRPLIGIPCFAAERAGTGRPIYGNNQAYVRAIEAAGGAPVLIPPELGAESILVIRAKLGGLLLTGGGDLDPAFYDEAPLPQSEAPERERDQFELDLTHWALDRSLPLLGVCRGMQVLNVAQGGTLYQDVPMQRPDAKLHLRTSQPRSQRIHGIEVRPGSRLAEIFGSTHQEVNSLHHQAVNRIGKDIEVVAWAEDGIAEAMEIPSRPFVLAVQYHPEELAPDDEASRRLFAAFVRACQERDE